MTLSSRSRMFWSSRARLLEKVWEEGAREHVRDKIGSFEDLVCPHTVASGKEEAEAVRRWRAWMERQARGAPWWTGRPCVPAPSHSARPQAWGVGPALSPPFCRWGDGGWRKKSIHVTQSPPPADRPDALQTPLSG